ncbi:H-NS histone family protein [Oxalobacteraceae sp. CFBP 8755]|nr:H-NS histone family protein [Oxalobacteraceae sp. CFBP 8761]MBD8626986.1 H-NS histone family protein [Oxalobacteraceae sp. CFBP 8753]MBD8631485.1 H-NS histone family protein [Oxalobacteraceae sp. CFBP 8755]
MLFSLTLKQPATMQDLSKYSLAKLRALEEQVNDALKTHHFLSISKAREQILHIARNAGLTEKQVLAIKAPVPGKPTAAAVSYTNPDDSAQQWSGRGRQPAWVKAWLAAGKSLEDIKTSV